MKNNKILLSALALSIMTPAIVIPMTTETVEAATSAKTFSDVPESHIYYDVITDMTEKGIINGYSDNTFKPRNEVTRAQVAAMLNRSLKLEIKRGEYQFEDVKVTNPYYADIQAVYQAGIFDGTNGKFNPYDSLTRGQMAKVLTLAFELKETSDKQFSDTLAHWSNEYVKTIYKYGITTGVTENEYRPHEKVKRQNYALFLHRALLQAEKVTPPPIPMESNTNINTPINEFNEVIANDPVYELDSSGIKAMEETYSSIPYRRLLTEARDTVETSGFKYKNVGGFIVIAQPNETKSQILVDTTSEGELNFKVDFRNKEVVDLTRKLMKIAYPEVDIDSIIDVRSTEASNAYNLEKDIRYNEREFQGNSSTIENAGYKIKVGTNVYLEFFWIEVDKAN